MSIPSEVQAYLKGPSCPAPEGKTSNLDNPSNRNGEALFFVILCIVLVTTATFARGYSRIFIVKQFHIEDYLGIGAIIPFAGYACTYLYFRQHVGFFVQQWDLPGSVLIDSGYISLMTAISYSLLMLLLKTAIILEWIRIFVPHRTRNISYWSSVAMILINASFYVASIAVAFGNCRPLEKLWHFWIPGTCIESKGRDIASAGINLAQDIFIVALPQRIIWTLQMTTSRRIGVALAFSVGLLVVATAIGRVHTIVTMDYPNDLTKPFNTAYKYSQGSYWVLSEVTCIFLVFCVPALPKLFEDQVIIPRIRSSWRCWMHLPQEPLSKQSTEAGWPSNIQTLSDFHRGVDYHKNVVSDTGTESSTIRRLSMEHSAHGGYHNSSGSHLHEKTKKFNSREDAVSRSSPDPDIELQPPGAAHNV